MLGHVNSAYNGCSHEGESLLQIFRLACLCWGLGLAGNAGLLSWGGDRECRVTAADRGKLVSWAWGLWRLPPAAGLTVGSPWVLLCLSQAALIPSSAGSATCVLSSQPPSLCRSILGGACRSPQPTALLPQLRAPPAITPSLCCSFWFGWFLIPPLRAGNRELRGNDR